MRDPNPVPVPGTEPIVQESHIDDALTDALAVALGGRPAALSPDGTIGMAAMMLAAGPPSYLAMVTHPQMGPLEELRHVSIEFERTGVLRAGDAVTCRATVTEVGRVGTSLGLGIEVRVTASAGQIAAARVVAQLGSPATAVVPALAMPHGPRAPELVARTVQEVVDQAAVLAWVSATGDEVPIHRADTPEAVDLGMAVVPGGLTVARLLDHATRAAAGQGRAIDRAQFRFRRIVGIGVPVEFAFGVPDVDDTAVVGVATADGPAITAVHIHTVPVP